jgi:hypothetical protein
VATSKSSLNNKRELNSQLIFYIELFQTCTKSKSGKLGIAKKLVIDVMHHGGEILREENFPLPIGCPSTKRQNFDFKGL